MNQRGLAGAGNARDAGHHSKRNFDVDIFQIVLCGIAQLQHLRPRGSPFLRNRNLQFADQIFSGERGVAILSCLRASLINKMPAVFAGARSKIENVIRRLSSFPRRVRRPGRYSRYLAAVSGFRSAAGHRADAGRSKAHRERTARRQATNPVTLPAECAALHRPTESKTAGPASDTANRHHSEIAAAIESPAGCVPRSAPAPESSVRFEKNRGSPGSSSGKRPRCSCR